MRLGSLCCMVGLLLACGTDRASVEEGWAAALAGDHAGAQAAFERATTETPERAEAWVGLAYAQLHADAPEPAFTSAERAVALAPDSPDAQELLGMAALRSDRPTEAAAALGRAFELDPRRTRLCFPLGRAREQAELWSEAQHSYERCGLDGVMPARSYVRAARVLIDGAENPSAERVLRGAEALLDRAADANEDDDEAVYGGIGVQRRRIARTRRDAATRTAALIEVLRDARFGQGLPEPDPDAEPSEVVRELAGEGFPPEL